MSDIHTATIAHHTDWRGFRQQARALLRGGVPPEQVLWQVADAPQPDLFASGDPCDAHQDGASSVTVMPCAAPPHPSSALGLPAIGPKTPQVPARFLDACQRIILHSDVERLALMYRLLWRLQREPMLRNDVLDPDVQRASQLQRQVQREIHHMHAFVRFRPLQAVAEWDAPAVSGVGAAQRVCSANRLEASGAKPGPALQIHTETWQVAWFEPQHHTVQAAAPFFARRFPNHCWAILAPLGSVYWDTHVLHHGAAASAADVPQPDADEQLWLAYYASSFNPARLKLATLQHCMPRHYWKNLPEAQLIQPLAATAHRRTEDMLRGRFHGFQPGA